MSLDDAKTTNDFAAKTQFVCALAKQLHEAGTPAGRLENALNRVGAKIALDISVWSSPTAIILGFADQDLQKTIVLRLQPGGVDLRTMCAIDDIAERVIRGELNAQSGARALTLAAAPVSNQRFWLETIVGFVMANIGVACLLKLQFKEIAVCGAVGLVLALLHIRLGNSRRFMEGLDAICAVVAAFLVAIAAAKWGPINYRGTLLASLVVLVPGLTITIAATEIATQHLVSGTARMAGAFATLLKLAFGSLVGGELAQATGFVVQNASLTNTLVWLPWLGLMISAVSFAILFKARLADYWLAIGAAILGYVCTQFGGAWYGQEFAVFFAGLVVTLTANTYARIWRRPGALIRLPGIILLVPGSVGFRSLAFVFEQQTMQGLNMAVSLLLTVVALVAGILFAGTLVAPRNSL